MTDAKDDPASRDPLVRNARIEAERDATARREGEPAVAQRLAQIGVLGWIIVIPILIGVFLGRWLDRSLGTGLFWTAPLLMLGAVLGGWSAWRWMQKS
jgi:ATP synthase protein I